MERLDSLIVISFVLGLIIAVFYIFEWLKPWWYIDLKESLNDFADMQEHNDGGCL